MANLEDNGKPGNEFTKLPAMFKEWQGVIVAVGGAVAAVLTIFLPQSKSVQIIGYVVATVLVVGGGFIFISVRRRRQAKKLRDERRRVWEREIGEARQAAFRGLFPYQENDELPGEHRQREAGRLVTQFSDPKFFFGVVCGDSGCGKTSLLRSAIQGRLKIIGAEKGFSVLYVTNPRELAEDGTASGERLDAGRKLQHELDKLKQLAVDAGQSKPLILIIDQFEEFFIEYRTPEQRLEIGKFLNGLIRASPPVRILCAIRRDYLADMKDLAPLNLQLGSDRFFEPISLQSLFTLKNFTREQAAKVIKECAERDRMELHDDLANTLATDLAESDFVRPPELQIVCTALVGSPTMAEYRLAGGAKGILSHHIEGAIDISGDPTIGRRVLRAVCDFPAHAKRNPQSVSKIAEAIGVDDPSAMVSIRTALRQFEVARLIVSEKSAQEEPNYALVHDYLVDAVAKATSDVSTRDEEANQMLEYYVSEYRTDEKTRIPYRRLRFVKKYADRKKLSGSTAKRLVRASMMRLITSAAGLSAFVIVATALLVAVTTTRRDWRQEVVGSHWEGNDSGEVEPRVYLKGDLVLTGFRRHGGGRTKLWDERSASLVNSLKLDQSRYVAPYYVIGASKGAQFITAFHIPSGREFQTALPTTDEVLKSLFDTFNDPLFSENGTFIAFQKGEKNEDREGSITVFSLAANKVMGEIASCVTANLIEQHISSGGDYLVQLCKEGPTAFSLQPPGRKVLVRPDYDSKGFFALDENSSRLASVEVSRDRRYYVVLWDVRTGNVIDQTEVSNPTGSNSSDISPHFTPDGAFLYLNYRKDFSPESYHLEVFRTAGLRRMTEVPETGVRRIDANILTGDAVNTTRPILAWTKDVNGTYLWDLAEPQPRFIQDLRLPKAEYGNLKISVSGIGVRAIVAVKEKGQIELWDLTQPRKLATLETPGRYSTVEFTIRGNAVSVNVEGGTISLFRADTGEKITDSLRNIGGTERTVYYDPDCQRVHVWTDEGRVLRYTEGWYIFGREKWFRPVRRC